MNSILSEKEYQSFIIDRLKENGYEVSLAKDFDRQFAVNRKDLFKFLNTTQPDKMEKFRRMSHIFFDRICDLVGILYILLLSFPSFVC